MDIVSIGAAVAKVKSIPGSAAQRAETAAAAAEAAVETLSDSAVRYDEAQELTTDQKLMARENIGAADADAMDLVVDPVVYWLTGNTASLSNHRMTRDGDMFTLNSTQIGYSVYFRLGGTLGVVSTKARATEWESEIVLEEGVAYTMSLTPISGTVTGSFTAYIYPEGANVEAANAVAGVKCTGGSSTFVWLDGTKKAKIVVFISTTTGGNNFAFRLTLSKTAPLDNAVNVKGSSPVIVALPNCRYNCTADTVAELDFTPSDKGISSVRFTSGSTPTVLTMPNTVVMPSWWTGVEASRTYEISIEDGVYGAVTSWA